MIVTVKEIVESDSFQTQHGLLYGWKFVATDEQGTDHWLGINTKKPDGLAVGKSFDFLASGKMAGIYTLGKRADMAQGQPYRGGATPAAPASRTPASGPANAPQRHVPTMSQAVAVLKECVEAVQGWGSEAHATTLFLGRLRGDIRRDPTQAEQDAAKAEAEAALAALKAAEEAERQRQAEEAKAKLAGYAAASGVDSEIPF